MQNMRKKTTNKQPASDPQYQNHFQALITHREVVYEVGRGEACPSRRARPGGLESSLAWTTRKGDRHDRDGECTAGVGEAPMTLMSECGRLREFGARVLALAANVLMSTEADAACGTVLGERSTSRANSRMATGGAPSRPRSATWSLKSPGSDAGHTTRSPSWSGGRGSTPRWRHWPWRPTPAAS